MLHPPSLAPRPKDCWGMPNLVQAIASAVSLLIYVPLGLLFTMARLDLNPASLKAMTEAHTGVEMQSFGVKVALVAASVLITSFPWLSLVLFALAAYHLFLFLYWQPHQQVRVRMYGIEGLGCLSAGAQGAYRLPR